MGRLISSGCEADECWRGRQGCGDKGKDAHWMSLGFNQMPFDDNEDAITVRKRLLPVFQILLCGMWEGYKMLRIYFGRMSL